MSKVRRGLGAVLSVPAGGGKTLLARQVWQRHGQPDTLILCPAALVGQIDHVLARRPETVKALSYERLANPSADTRIDFVPSLVILDEAHRVSRDSVVYRILQRLKERHNPTIVCMTGTLMRRSLRDYAHLFALALDENSPLPRDPGEIDLWADALDENVPYDRRARPDAICRLFDTPSKDLDTLRSLLYASLSEHPQVYMPLSAETAGPGLTIRWYRPGQMFRLSGSEDPADRQRYEQLARWVDAVDSGTDPMGNTILDGFAAGRLRRTVPLGWLHLPKDLPREILIARADWEHLVKQEIAAGRALSEGRVAQIPSIRETAVYKRWSAVRARYRRSERPVLLDPGLDPLFSVPSPRPGPVIGLPPRRSGAGSRRARSCGISAPAMISRASRSRRCFRSRRTGPAKPATLPGRDRARTADRPRADRAAASPARSDRTRVAGHLPFLFSDRRSIPIMVDTRVRRC